jgi:hypothetical protein
MQGVRKGKDPVADPLDPPATWRFGHPAGRPPGQAGLLRAAAASGELIPITIDDREVDNLARSSGGCLQAHNYWDNITQFIPDLADLPKE